MPCGTVKLCDAARASTADGPLKSSPNPRLSFDFPPRSKPQTSASAMMNDDSAAANGKCAIHVIAITSVPWSNDIQKYNIIHK